MTVSIDYVTQYASNIADLFSHAKKVLKTGAILYLGGGDVDMKYSERKIKKFACDLFDTGVRGVMVSDARY